MQPHYFVISVVLWPCKRIESSVLRILTGRGLNSVTVKNRNKRFLEKFVRKKKHAYFISKTFLLYVLRVWWRKGVQRWGLRFHFVGMQRQERLLNSLLRSQTKNSSDSLELKRFITMITAIHYVHLFWSRWIHSIPTHLIALISTSILSPHPCTALPSGHFCQSFLAERLHAVLFTTNIPCAPQSCHPLFDDLTNIFQGSQIMKLLTGQFSPTSVALSWAQTSSSAPSS